MDRPVINQHKSHDGFGSVRRWAKDMLTPVAIIHRCLRAVPLHGL